MSNKDYKLSVFLGRFQPFHKGHLAVALKGLEIADKLVIVVGSALAAPNIKNPFTFEQRKEMIISCLSAEELTRVSIVPVRDYFYDDAMWVSDVKNKVGAFYDHGDSVALVGNVKDDSSYYIKYFNDWKFTPVRTGYDIDATTVRSMMFGNKFNQSIDLLPQNVSTWLENNFISTPKFNELQEEFDAVKQNKIQYGNGPFVTVDSIITCKGHVLMVKRGHSPGKGLWALPGGFLKPDERIKDGAVRELYEETRLLMHKDDLEQYYIDSNVFDHPSRSLRGRTITHAFHYALDVKELPKVHGADDAIDAQWISLQDLARIENEIYEDHFSIINHFIWKNK